MKKLKWAQRQPNNTEDCFTTSISDLMAGLLNIFILALAYYILNFSVIREQWENNDTIRNQFLKEIQSSIVMVEIDEKKGTITLPEGLLFNRGEAKFKNEESKKLIKKLSFVFVKLLNEDKYSNRIDTIFIEGHTDNTQVKGKAYGNWELSVNRAIETWKLMNNAGTQPKISTLTNKKGEPFFSCSGYADTRPVIPDATNEKGHEANRRISFRVTVTPPPDRETTP